MGREAGFWLAVALVAIVATKVFPLLAASTPLGSIPGVATLAALPS